MDLIKYHLSVTDLQQRRRTSSTKSDNENTPVTAEYIQGVMREYLQINTFKVKKISCKRPLQIGDNYIADVIRVKVEGEFTRDSKTSKIKKYVIVKKPIEDDANTPPEIFKFESSFYNNVLAELEDAFGSKLPVIRIIKAEKTSVVTDDFVESGWNLCKRLAGTNQAQSILVIKSLAKLHAASIILSQTNEVNFKKLSEHVRDQIFSDSTADVCKKTLADAYAVAKYRANRSLLTANGNESNSIANFLSFTSDEIYMLAKMEIHETPEFAKVFVHGDCWTNNFMLKKDITAEALLINLSSVCLSTPARDLVYLFATNPHKGINQSALTQLYVEELHKHLIEHKISSDIIKKFSLQFIESEINRLEFFSLLTAIWLLLPICYTSYPTIEKYNSIERKDKPEFVARFIDRKFYNRRLIKLLVAYAKSAKK